MADRKPPKWERLEPGVYRFLCQNSKGTFLVWVERGCDTHTRDPHWYWAAGWISKNGGELDPRTDKDVVGWEMTLADAKEESMVALGRMSS